VSEKHVTPETIALNVVNGNLSAAHKQLCKAPAYKTLETAVALARLTDGDMGTAVSRLRALCDAR